MDIVPDGVVVLYTLIGISHMIFGKDVQQWYVVLLYFIVLKMLFQYDKCTLSYFECKLRGVKKEDGYLYSFLDKFIKMRGRPIMLTYVVLFTIYVTYYYYSRGNRIRI